jgi:hypothetical protein
MSKKSITVLIYHRHDLLELSQWSSRLLVTFTTEWGLKGPRVFAAEVLWH